MKKNIINKKINIYIGLEEQKTYKKISKQKALKVISQEFINIGIIGFNVSPINGYWNTKKEASLLISFINTFKITEKDLNKCIENIKMRLNQEAILKEIQPLSYAFI